MNVLVIDNYDSFTFNLVQYLGALETNVTVRRNDEIAVEEIDTLAPDAIVISPGPGEPIDAGISIDTVHRCARRGTPLLGVCLGHQAIAQAFGGRIVRAPSVMHGKTSFVHHRASGVLRHLPDPFEAMRYHSLVVDRATLPDELEVTAWTSDDVLMGLRHRDLPIEGVQFHPESILTSNGMKLVENFLRAAAVTGRR